MIEAFEDRLAAAMLEGVTCSPDCYHSEVESGSFMMVV
jgi:lipoate synthase